jgi:cytochrome c oxidase subunit 3
MATQTAVAPNATTTENRTWEGGGSPFGASFGKIMMWFFLVSDAFTFASFLISYGVIRATHEYWPNPEMVFNAFPGIEGHAPLVFVGLMTFILIVSSVTMVLAVEAGHNLDKNKAAFYMVLTIIGGAAFLGCQAWEWSHLIDHGMTLSGNPFGPDHTQGPALFGQLFFSITGFHGAHVTSGVIINIIILINIMRGVYDKKKDYEIVEKVGLYWHFVDLVWVFVFTFFYLV